MTEYLDRALNYVGAVEGEVIWYGMSDDGTAYILLLDKGIKGCPKHRIPLDKLKGPVKKAEPVPVVVVVEEEAEELPYSTPDDVPDLDELGYRDLQALAKEYDIPANQSTEDLRTALREVI